MFYTNDERYEFVRQFKKSKLNMTEFCLLNKLTRTTFKDWVNAFDSISGSFLDVSKLPDVPLALVNEEDLTVNLLKPQEIIKKSSHFSRFDHSIVVVEYKEIKITTSLNQDLEILKVFYDRH